MGLFGIQKSLIQIRNFSGHAGIDFGIGYGKAKKEYGGKEYGDKQSSLQGEIRPYIGIDWYFVKNFFIGLECGYDFTYISDKLGDSKSTLFSTGLAETNYASVKIGYCF